MWALVVNIFCPLMTHSSPSRTARVWADATSEPDSGSLKPSTIRISARITRGRIACFCSSVPTARIILATAMVVPLPVCGAPARLSSSPNAITSIGSRPWPPSSAGQPGASHRRAASSR